MSTSYDVFGRYLLFRRLEKGALSELWRAGRVDGDRVGGTVALRRFTGGDLPALREAALAARGVVRKIEGTTVVREQVVDVAEGTPFIAHDYPGGRTLHGIADLALSPGGGQPIPVDQALGIAERLAASMQMLGGIRLEGSRLVHGALIPQLVWISEEGEVRVAGQHLSRGIIASLRDPAVREEIGAFLAPEVRDGAAPTPQADVWSIGAAVHLMLFGKAPATPEDVPDFREARLLYDDEPVPDDVRPILEQTLAKDPARRFAGPEPLHQALARLVAGGYASSTFNLAFYLHTVLKGEIEQETNERKREADADVAASLARKEEETARAAPPPEPEPPPPPARPATVPARAAAVKPDHAPSAPPLTHPESRRSRAPLVAGALVVLLAGGAGAFLLVRGRTEPPPAPVQTAPAPAASLAAMDPFAGEAAPDTPILTAIAPTETAAPPAETVSATPAPIDEAARQRAVDEEVERRLREEVARLQAEYERQLAAERAKVGARPTPSVPAETRPARREPDPEPAPAAARSERPLDADTLNRRTLEEIEAERPATTTADQKVAAPAKAETTATPAPPPAPAVREGDLVDFADLDRKPELVHFVEPEYPPIARKRRLTGSVILTVLIDETGAVADVRVLRGDSTKIGFDEAAVRAARRMRFSPPMKDGKRVRTWLAFPVNFQLD